MISFPKPEVRIPRWCLIAVLLMGSSCLLMPTFAADTSELKTVRPNSYEVISECPFVFINGKHVTSPFEIQFDPGRLTVNGVQIQVPAYDDFQQLNLEMQHSEGDNWFGRNGGRRGSGERGQTKRPYSPERAYLRQLQDRLQQVDILIAFDHFPVRSLPVDSEGLSAALLSDSHADYDWNKILLPTESAEEAAVWRRWLETYQVPAEVKERLQEAISSVQQMDAEILAVAAGTDRLDRYAYPLTVLGMLLGVFAFGHMLQWAGNGLHRKDMSEESERYVILALGMMAGMAFIDFLWTVLAGQAGQMKEVNPLAANFIDSPAQLAIFKIVATGIGFAILYFWRQRQQIQKVAWWMCLVCVLLTFRWVMFDSMRA